MMLLKLDSTTGLFTICTPHDNMIQVFDSGEWRDFRGIPRDSQRLLQNHQSGNKASKWALHEQETKVRFLKKYEYEIRLSMARDLSEELVRQRDKCIAANSQDDHETPLVRTIIPDPVSKVGDYLLIKPIGGQLNQQTYTAMNCLTCEIVSLAKFRVTSEDEKDALRLLQWLYGAGKVSSALAISINSLTRFYRYIWESHTPPELFAAIEPRQDENSRTMKSAWSTRPHSLPLENSILPPLPATLGWHCSLVHWSACREFTRRKSLLVKRPLIGTI